MKTFAPHLYVEELVAALEAALAGACFALSDTDRELVFAQGGASNRLAHTNDATATPGT